MMAVVNDDGFSAVVGNRRGITSIQHQQVADELARARIEVQQTRAQLLTAIQDGELILAKHMHVLEHLFDDEDPDDVEGGHARLDAAEQMEASIDELHRVLSGFSMHYVALGKLLS
jgi:alkylation response protein AidB-like acyl-CoA dehydrogenase